jgi:hypothetical protein
MKTKTIDSALRAEWRAFNNLCHRRQVPIEQAVREYMQASLALTAAYRARDDSR